MSLVLGKLHEVGCLEEFLQLVYHLLVARLAQTVDDFAAGHLHGVEAEAVHYIFAQRIGELGVVFLLALLAHGMVLLDLIDFAQCLLVGWHSLHDADAGDDRLVVLEPIAQIKHTAAKD